MEQKEEKPTEQSTEVSISDKPSSSEGQKQGEKPNSDKDIEKKEIKKESKPHSKNNPIKEKVVKALAEKIKGAKTLMIVSIKGLPSKQFQDIKKTLRGDALVQVAKKNIMLKAIEAVEKDAILDLQKQVQENCAFVISDMEGYELAGILATKKNPIYAKAGQEAPEDIEVKPGPTDLVPGPAISELGALGIQIAIEDGKISIKAPRIVVNKGQEISESAASVLQKLNIQPFSVGLEPVAVYDVEDEKIYTDIKINPEETAEELKTAASKALGFAQKIVYYCKETIGYLLAKANADNGALSELGPAEEKPAEEEKEEEASEEVKPEEKKEEGSEEEKSDTETQTKSEEEKKNE